LRDGFGIGVFEPGEDFVCVFEGTEEGIQFFSFTGGDGVVFELREQI
jgi:hypothetical protein